MGNNQKGDWIRQGTWIKDAGEGVVNWIIWNLWDIEPGELADIWYYSGGVLSRECDKEKVELVGTGTKPLLNKNANTKSSR